MMKTIGDVFNEVEKEINDKCDEILARTTSASANTLRKHLKNVTIKNSLREIAWSTLTSLTNEQDYEDIKERPAALFKQLSIKDRARWVKARNLDLLESISTKYTQHKQLFSNACHKQGGQ